MNRRRHTSGSSARCIVHAFRHGDESVQNAVAVSFSWGAGWSEPGRVWIDLLWLGQLGVRCRGLGGQQPGRLDSGGSRVDPVLGGRSSVGGIGLRRASRSPRCHRSYMTQVARPRSVVDAQAGRSLNSGQTSAVRPGCSSSLIGARLPMGPAAQRSAGASGAQRTSAGISRMRNGS